MSVPSPARIASYLRTLLGVVLGLTARAWLLTLRLTVHADSSLDPSESKPWVLVFWHGEQFPLLAWPRRRRTVALVSLSPDGQIQAQALRRVGLFVERGSTSRRGAAGLLAVVRRLRDGFDAAFAVDGPRGPRLSVAPGAAAAAMRAGALLVPMGSSCVHGHTFARAWDRYRLPWPFTRVSVVLGPALDPRRASAEQVASAITAASHKAEAELAALRS
jgi:lysophospholipid acyltransferase (LPLAT)-like uncharacterized protein